MQQTGQCNKSSSIAQQCSLCNLQVPVWRDFSWCRYEGATDIAALLQNQFADDWIKQKAHVISAFYIQA